MNPDSFQDIGHGIQFSSQGAIESRMLGAYRGAKGTFHFGYFYLNGSNNRVVSWENGHRVNRTVNRWTPVILFKDVITPYSFKSSKFSSEDFNLPWLYKAQVDLQNELKAQEFHNVTSQMARLSMNT